MMENFFDPRKRRRSFSRHSYQHFLLLCILPGLIMLLFAVPSYSQSYVEFSEIWSADISDYNEFQAKITYMGVQSKSVKSLAFSAEGYMLDLGLFVPFQYAEAGYSNDSHVLTLELSAVEFQKFVDGIRAHPELQPLGYNPTAVGAIALLRGYPPQEKAWEHMCTESELRTVFSILYSSIDMADVDDLETVLARKRNFVAP